MENLTTSPEYTTTAANAGQELIWLIVEETTLSRQQRAWLKDNHFGTESLTGIYRAWLARSVIDTVIADGADNGLTIRAVSVEELHALLNAKKN